MGKLRKLTAITCSLVVAVSMLAGCSPKTQPRTSSDSGEPVPLSIIEPDLGRVLKPDTENKPLAELEKRTNTKLTLTLVPQSDFKNKYSVLAGSGNLPDISRLSTFDYQDYAGQGLYMDVGSIVDENAPNLKKYISKENWDLVAYQGKTYCIPYLNTDGKRTTVFRQDWLDNLGLEIPTTLDDYKKVLEAFTFNDPDKNGKNDTYGLGAGGGWTDIQFGSDFQGIFGAYGLQTDMSYLKDNKIYSNMITDEYRQAIQYIKSLWNEKVIDPEVFTIKPDQAEQKLVQSKSGSITAWWSIIPEIVIQQLKMNEINPNAKWTPLTKAITGPNGQGSYASSGVISATNCISAKCKNPIAAVKFLDYLAGDDGWELAHNGIKGEDWTEIGAPRTEQGQKAMDEKWLDPVGQLVSRNDRVTLWSSATTDPVVKRDLIYQNACAGMTLYTDILYGVPKTDEYITYNNALLKYEVSSFINFITGATPLTDASWESYVDTWKNVKSGQKILDSQIKSYNDWKGTKYTAGN